jgi:hypothetical protein
VPQLGEEDVIYGLIGEQLSPRREASAQVYRGGFVLDELAFPVVGL